ncbi:toll/interleukin-1 receptor domain-containing protein [Variovorax sp. dw_954]|uniref:toll/interleukin-1 receptor domain-containing protein n=1 Tax=Variovorax sp. dw_954 TaxID=2720078 RepID=UPI001BD2F620|nr:toll/interleukin-1 receptor domain-containing protein [Variovorax sp. dw_954]
MADFNWVAAALDDLRDRYKRPHDDADEWVDIGPNEWAALVERLREIGSPDRAEEDSWTRSSLGAFDAFLNATWAEAQEQKQNGVQKPCRVFVSHQQADVVYAERIAWLANKNGLEYWLDVHDPVLRLANGWALPPLTKSILIASIIEMALLNCSHVIAVQTKNAVHSRWVPYEFGRAKQHILHSSQAASWFDVGMDPVVNGNDYLLLGICAKSEAAVINWLQNHGGGCMGTNPKVGTEPAPLPI